MPKIVANPKTRAQIQKDSDARRRVKPIGFKVPIEFAELLDELAKQSGKTKNIIIMEAVELWAKQL
ncbi:ribbon-helix-helix domain-containing protein [Moraxella catarrhalis]|uniref:hypothetical protein n=1 Tax=Moraxella catarrhalis TaxID=480 RepID=UPI000E558161|nr:hypothetical protein [Moraxella catarrhalis]AXT96519.1 hypothetical protein SQ01_04375 [Moraxella catarrhalis]MCG6832761.1 hypothetical protein [Moraxella catarrhalis]MPW89352.1 hypothetical protein [Moraxella catarrhalis]MPX86146.1 hypothetical protein [Moraxella catarrhalis]